jgi:predicted transcriptional regulator
MLNHRDPNWLATAKAITGMETGALAKLAGVSPDTLQRIANGSLPSLRTFQKIEDAVKASLQTKVS